MARSDFYTLVLIMSCYRTDIKISTCLLTKISRILFVVVVGDWVIL